MSKPKRKMKKAKPARTHRRKASTKRTVAAAKKNVLVTPPKPSPATPPVRDLWLEILRREERLKSMTEAQVRAELDSGGFPENLISAFIERRNSSPSGWVATQPNAATPPAPTQEAPVARNPETGLPADYTPPVHEP